MHFAFAVWFMVGCMWDDITVSMNWFGVLVAIRFRALAVESDTLEQSMSGWARDPPS